MPVSEKDAATDHMVNVTPDHFGKTREQFWIEPRDAELVDQLIVIDAFERRR